MLKLKETPEKLHQRTYVNIGSNRNRLNHTHTPCSKHTHTHTIVRSFYGFLKEHCIFPCLYFPRKSGELKLSKPGQEMNQNTVIMHLCYSQSFSRGRYRDRYKMGSYKRSHFYYKMVYLKTCNCSVAK